MSLRAANRAEAGRLIDVSRETWARLERLVETLDHWQAATNLVAPSTLDAVWTRHVADSAQLARLAPDRASVWVDIGSGAGFPGLVVAAMRLDMRVHLVESNAKKVAFLRAAARAMDLDVVVQGGRAQGVIGALTSVDVVSARALASLTELLGLASPLLKTGALGLFPKGREAVAELTQAKKSWRFEASLSPSLTDREARIVRVESFAGPR